VAKYLLELAIDMTGAFSAEHLNKVSHNQQVQKMIDNHNEFALSEVIGFVLILALITVAFSLYLVYGVPAQGRENEILHMVVIKDQFSEYKIGLDSLFNNNLVGSTISSTFSLGTGGGYTQGSNSIFPILSPASSGGIFLINRRTTFPETLTITSNSYITGNGSTSVSLPALVNYTPNHVYVNISGIAATDLSSTSSFGVKVNTSKWIATINLTPQVTYFTNFTKVGVSQSTPTCSGLTSQFGPVLGPYYWETGGTYGYECLVPALTSNYTVTDLTISITKGNIPTMQNYPVFNNVKSGVNYSVDLMDSSYGLNTVTLPGDTIYIERPPSKPLGLINGTGTVTYDFAEQTSYKITPIPLGAIEYRSDNNYWIPQSYYYQMGGVFLSQSDGNTTYKLPPEISFNYNYSSKITTVNINALAISNPLGGSVVGGNSPIQIKTTLMNKKAMPFAVGTANTRRIQIGVNTSDDQARVMWKNYFNYTARAAYLPNTLIGNTTTEIYIIIDGYDPSPTGAFDINVIASDATYSATVYGVGG